MVVRLSSKREYIITHKLRSKLSVQIIAEIGSNWEGDVEVGKIHIRKAKECGVSYVKFQMWRAKDLYDTSHPQWDFIKKSELCESTAKELKNYADKIGIKWFCSVFYPESVDFLESINVPLYKIASRTATLKDRLSLETIQKVAQTRKPTFISTGEGADKEVIKKQFKEKTYKFTYCVSQYPTPDEAIDWKEILKFNFFSDHTLGIIIPITYVILKKPPFNEDVFIEKHVKLESSKGPDSSYSITFKELEELVKNVNRVSMLKLASFDKI